MMALLLTSLEKKISGSVMFLTAAKEMWDTLKVMYGNEKNPSRVFEIYERLFELKQGDRPMPEFYGKFKGLIDELEISACCYCCDNIEGISLRSSGIKISIWLESYTMIPDVESDTGRR